MKKVRKDTDLAKVVRQKVVEIFVPVCYNTTIALQGSYIGNTTASQAVKAGSIPVPCSKKEVAFVYQKLLLFLSIAKAMVYHHALACISSRKLRHLQNAGAAMG